MLRACLQCGVCVMCPGRRDAEGMCAVWCLCDVPREARGRGHACSVVYVRVMCPGGPRQRACLQCGVCVMCPGRPEAEGMFAVWCLSCGGFCGVCHVAYLYVPSLHLRGVRRSSAACCIPACAFAAFTSASGTQVLHVAYLHVPPLVCVLCPGTCHAEGCLQCGVCVHVQQPRRDY
jgi:hypothetical protein